ncbi:MULTISPECIES: 4-(cytidine 5'-diphospho)-2-C-methyl-D-erythritol kinase [Thermoanaerobacterium]|uniref:4-diphosphocytidyl-2-C-methyl-D-erythritol kinase n=2 Tax=Thermoanaerobacterium TaxID=28895 RepID=W9EA75_9THEO|nr:MULTISPECIES: 4-(cytidine 5'-diphospho)-2-C-methyl-D-erythritol kinase [Thermoanaerobacterium]AFK85770.1 4-diphosphocytidyl-2-C-methyl-D-erythritol kinase [Thermoanaerobacterium saccharolyticum JW/SL-YS485]ETO38021.1 4-diphosphocytidyl-2-C-methyl-D-erythritol kinase [Thermoanaerobacterium aotearoense SCUT27]
MNKLKAKSYAKINLALDVKGKRDDGYHFVEMVLQSIDLYDKLEFEMCDDIVLECERKDVPTDRSNLIIKAADLLKREFGGYGVHIRLKKNIPVAAGLAGGSSNAAATLVALNKLWNLNIKLPVLKDLAASLGADVPFCIEGGTKAASGIGDVLQDLETPHLRLLIVRPSVSVSTKDVYTEYDNLAFIENNYTKNMIDAIRSGSIINICMKLGNDLERVTIRNYPIIGDIKKMMVERGALGTLMSGSGPTVFGIFDDSKKLDAAYDSFVADGFYAYISNTIDKGIELYE